MRWIALVVAAMPLLCGAVEFRGVAGEELRGAAVVPGVRPRLLTWGKSLLEWTLPQGKKRVLATPRKPFGEGGCLTEEGDGLFLQEDDGSLVLRRAPDWQSSILDHGIDMHDCLATTLFGRRGVLVLQRGMQLRFYEAPDFHYLEIYSFYSLTRQGGLLLAGADIVCGNYWIRRPDKYEEPWLLFAIEVYNELPLSGMLRLALLPGGGELVIAQGEMVQGRVTRLRKPDDPKQLWIEERLGELHYPHALLNTSKGVLIGEENGPHSRLFALRPGTSTLRQIGETNGVHTALAYGTRVILVGRNSIYLRK